MRAEFLRLQSRLLTACLVILVALSTFAGAERAFAQSGDLDVALGLANMLRAARSVIAANQGHINDPAIGDKGLSGDKVLEAAFVNYEKATGADPRAIDAESRFGRLVNFQMTAIRQVMDENQSTINKPGVGFKGFVPAVFGRLVNERFRQLIGTEAEVKVTAPMRLVRNRKARPDKWEIEAIRSRLLSPEWKKGQVYSTEGEQRGRNAFRALVPEYYGAGCLACHGEPKGEVDVTGYPKEGGKLGELGGVISVTLYR